MNSNSKEKMRDVFLVDHQANWQRDYENESEKIKEILSSLLVDIHHIGSTAIHDIPAKPIIDIMPIVKDINLVDQFNDQLKGLGYIPMGEYGIKNRRFFWKSEEKRTHHIHIFEVGNNEIERHIKFRDFLNQNKNYAYAYGEIKSNLASEFSRDIVNYVAGKSSFIEYIDFKTNTATEEQKQALDQIEIVPYDFAWQHLANAEIKSIQSICYHLDYKAIEHVGSTAVEGLASKPVIDLFVVIENISDALEWIKPLEALGYVFWEENPDKQHLRLFKGMPPFGKKRTHHLHIVSKDNSRWVHTVLFRDILKQNSEIRSEYEALKIKLSQMYQSDREAYTNHKYEFIKQVLVASGFDNAISI
ncbi:GrpB family protein [Thiotrichales bacterium 19S11-10]|nr:GrpB family protein [Thiotrichales bacterium 19S11-10]